MVPPEEVHALVGHAPGGVCPFCVNSGVQVFLDISLRRFPLVCPAAGSASSAVRLSPEELAQLCPGSPLGRFVQGLAGIGKSMHKSQAPRQSPRT